MIYILESERNVNININKNINKNIDRKKNKYISRVSERKRYTHTHK